MQCNWCKSPQDLYVTYFQNDRTEGKWRRGAVIHSCRNPKCPYKRNFVDGEVKEYPTEIVRIEKVNAFYQPSDTPIETPINSA